MIKQLDQALRDILPNMQLPTTELVKPTDSTHGDYTSNIAMILSKQLQKSPMEIAQKIVDDLKLVRQLTDGDLTFLDKVEVAAPGFINFWVSKKELMDSLTENMTDKNYHVVEFVGKKVILEYTDPNPFKEFHIGHVYTNTVGEALSRLLEKAGAEVKRVTYQGDVGLHVAKSLWGVKEQLKNEEVSDMDEKSPSERAKFLGQAYALGSKSYEEDENAKTEIIALNKKVYAKDPEVMQMYLKGRAWSLEYFDHLYKRLGSRFDRYFFESEVGEAGKQLVLEYVEKGIFEESQGAVIFPGEKYGLHSRVFINSLGLPTYEAKELGLAPIKYDYFPYDISLIITGAEIKEYFNVLLKALSLIRPELSERTRHIAHGMVRLPQGKMSSRTGNVITGEWLLDEAVTRTKNKIVESKKSKEEVSPEIAEMIGKGAVKYAMLKTGIGKDIEFNFDDSVSFEGNSGPYLQYTYVRTQSVLNKLSVKSEEVRGETTLEIEEAQLLRMLYHFPEIVSSAAKEYSPNTLATYLYELSQAFNLFYQKHKIIGSGDSEAFRLLLTQKIGETIKEGLNLLGIDAPDRM